MTWHVFAAAAANTTLLDNPTLLNLKHKLKNGKIIYMYEDYYCEHIYIYIERKLYLYLIPNALKIL